MTRIGLRAPHIPSWLRPELPAVGVLPHLLHSVQNLYFAEPLIVSCRHKAALHLAFCVCFSENTWSETGLYTDTVTSSSGATFTLHLLSRGVPTQNPVQGHGAPQTVIHPCLSAVPFLVPPEVGGRDSSARWSPSFSTCLGLGAEVLLLVP